MRAQLYRSALVVLWLGCPSDVAAQETGDTGAEAMLAANAEEEDTPDVETDNTVDTAEDKRGFTVSGDLRPIVTDLATEELPDQVLLFHPRP